MVNDAKVLMDVPYYSQWLDVTDPDWQRRSCGIAALKMAMDFLNGKTRESVDGLLKAGIGLPDAYNPKFGWVHDGLVALAISRGFGSSFRKERTADKSAEGINFIADILSQNIPVLASVKSPAGGHLILLIGFVKADGSLKGFYYHDPDSKVAKEGHNKFILKNEFLELWKGRIIVVKK